nr:uncharacterized protein I203_04668 [Kwoniella mangroviensis CBS 8507]OCF66337.1 hypothetical protein I203_04668 [Kwoniella mangroviensis CBS 8507]
MAKVLADMLEISSPVASETVVPSKRRLDNSSTPINIDYTSKVISHFLDLPNQANPAPSPFTYEDTKLLNELCDQFNVDHHFKEMVKDRLEGVLLPTMTARIFSWKVGSYGLVLVQKETMVNPTFDIESRRFTSEVTEAWDRSAREFDPDHESPY